MSLQLSGTSGVLDNSGAFIAGTAQASTSGTSIDFTGIPSWVKRVTVMFSGVSTNGSSPILIQLGTSGGIEATSYRGHSIYVNGGGAGDSAFSIGFSLFGTGGAGNLNSGNVSIALLGSNIWTVQGGFGGDTTNVSAFLGGAKTLSGTLDRVRITTVNGTDTFDAGSINILYE
jgi:hypothetical protein